MPGKIPGVKAEGERLTKFITRIAKGLLVRNRLKIYDWDDFRIESSLSQAVQSLKLLKEHPFDKVWKEGQYGEYWQNVFAYRGWICNEGSMWVMTFYSSYLGAVIFQKKD